MKRKALGKGLGSLIPKAPPRTPAPPPPAEVSPVARTGEVQLDIDRIGPNPRQPRKAFEEGALEELAASIQVQGLLQPVIVRPLGGGKFELVAPAGFRALDISSTAVRARARRGLPLGGLVPKPVEAYIRDHRLYRGR